jgi:phage terminase large subunit-like protein
VARKAPKTDAVTIYAKSVVAGKTIAGRPVRLACERHLRDLKEGKERGLRWDAERAKQAIDFFSEILVLEDGQPFKLLPYQAFIVGSCFGWYKADGHRRYRDAYVESGKGSGKSPLAAGIGLYGLIGDGEPAAEVYSAATTQDQARIVWKDADRMVGQNPELRDVVKQEAACLTYGTPESVFRPVSSEHRGLDGKRVHIGLIDELHEHPTAMVVDKIRAGTKRRKNALVFRITNSGFDRTSVCWKEHEYSIQVLEGVVENDAWFAYVCALDEGDDWRDEDVWLKVNPGCDAGLPPRSYLREQVAMAVGMPSKENIVRRLNFCEWTEQAQRWLDLDVWDENTGPVPAPALPVATPCFAALDAASTQDFTAYGELFGPDDEGVYDFALHCWLPEETLAAKDSGRSEQARLQIREWADAGWIKLTSGNVADYDVIEADVLALAEQHPPRELAFDRWNVTQLVTHLKDHMGEDRLVAFPQSFSGLSAPSKALEKLLAGRKLRHGGNPVLRWMASNVALRFGPDGQVKPDKERSAEKIDGILALVMALGRATVAPATQGGIYDSERPEGFLTL